MKTSICRHTTKSFLSLGQSMASWNLMHSGIARSSSFSLPLTFWRPQKPSTLYLWLVTELCLSRSCLLSNSSARGLWRRQSRLSDNLQFLERLSPETASALVGNSSHTRKDNSSGISGGNLLRVSRSCPHTKPVLPNLPREACDSALNLFYTRMTQINYL